MIQLQETKKYNINPRAVLSDAFTVSYSRFADTQQAAPPDTATMICSLISMVLVIAMLLLTISRYPDTIWYVLTVAAAAGFAYILYRYFKARNEYLKASGKPSTINQKRKEFFDLFESTEPLPDSFSAAELLNRVRPLLGKQNDNIFNTALRSVSESMIRVNNPELPVCKLITPMKETFTNARQRFYFTEEDGVLLFFDAEWMQPKGQITASVQDLVSFGKFSQYSQSINSAGGGKIRQDAVILELQDEAEHLYFEFAQSEYEMLRKKLPGKKEKK